MSNQPNTRSNRWSILTSIATVVLLFAPQPVLAQGIIIDKKDFLALVLKRMEDTNRGTGLSARFLSVGDPNKVLPKVDSYLNGVAVDPSYLGSYKLRQYFGAGAESGLTQPKGWSQRFDDVMTPLERKYDGWIILKDAPNVKSEETLKTAFHETIHAYHLAIEAGDVDKDKYEGPETISNSFSNVVYFTRVRIDPLLSRVLEMISRGQEYEMDLKTLRERITTQKNIIADYTPQFHTCLSNMGGKADFSGYELEVENRIKKAIEEAEKLNMGRNREIVLMAKPTITEQGGGKQIFLFDLQYRVNGLSKTETALVDAIVGVDGPSRPEIPLRTRKVVSADLKVQDMWAFSDLKPGDYTVRYLLNWPSNGRVSGIVTFKVVASRAAAPSCTADSLNGALGSVIPSLPFFGQSDAARSGKPLTSPLKMGYSVEDANGAVAFNGPAKILFGANWSIGCASGGQSETTSYGRNACNGFQSSTAGVLGENSCAASSGVRGAQDINFSGDPYMGGAKVVVVTEGTSITVGVSIAIHAAASHGARDKPDVITAVKKAAEDWAKVIASRLQGSGNIPRGVSPPIIVALLPEIIKNPEASSGGAIQGYFAQAKSYLQQRNLDGAQAQFEQAYQVAPNSAALNYNLSWLYQAQDRPLTALKYAENYLRLAPITADRADVEARMADLREDLQRNPRVIADSSGCRDVLAWAQAEQDAAKRGRDVARRQAVLEILLAAQRGECEKAKALQAGYKQRFGSAQ